MDLFDGDRPAVAEIALRLRRARIDGGHPSATAAAVRHGWSVPTYTAHENGTRPLPLDRLLMYGLALRADLVALVFGGGELDVGYVEELTGSEPKRRPPYEPPPPPLPWLADGGRRGYPLLFRGGPGGETPMLSRTLLTLPPETFPPFPWTTTSFCVREGLTVIVVDRDVTAAFPDRRLVVDDGRRYRQHLGEDGPACWDDPLSVRGSWWHLVALGYEIGRIVIES